MQKLNEFIGQIMSSIADARQIADVQSASLGEDYQANDFLSDMPIPHYTIDEAEVSVPVMVVGMATGDEDKDETIAKMLRVVENMMPKLYYRTIKNCYYDRQKKLAEAAGETEFMERKLSDEPELKKKYTDLAMRITKVSLGHFKTYLEEGNLQVFRLMDISEAYIDIIYKLSKEEFENYEEADLPYYEKADLKEACHVIGKRLLFEFRNVAKTTQGVLIEPSTNKMNEYATEDFLMHIKMKIKEQDLDYVVERDEKTGENKRYLSIT